MWYKIFKVLPLGKTLVKSDIPSLSSKEAGEKNTTSCFKNRNFILYFSHKFFEIMAKDIFLHYY